jgi:uncharacterized SAM-binding protein YcdF (DUF218 family)
VPPSASPRGGRLRRTFIVVTLALFLAGIVVFVGLGSFLAREDPLAKSDAIFVFAGTEMVRALEGADLYLAGYAPRVVLTYETADGGVLALRKRGIEYPARAEVERDVLVRLGVPRDAIIIPTRIHDNTAQEAQTVRELALRNHWQRVIGVTSKYHLRRAGFALHRELRGTGVQVVMHGTRYDGAFPSRWWERRGDIRFALTEAAKLIAYVLGLGA